MWLPCAEPYEARPRISKARPPPCRSTNYQSSVPVVRCSPKMGFWLESQNESPPAWPHFRCAGDAMGEGRGWAWQENERRRLCFSSERDINAPAALLAMAIDGGEPRIGHPIPGIDRMMAVVTLRRCAGNGFLLVFRDKCPCGSDHRIRPRLILSAFAHVHPLAIPTLRAARVPERLLREPHIIRRGDGPLPTTDDELRAMLAADPRKGAKVKRQLALSKNLPVYEGNAERTRLAQIRFALAYASKIGLPLPLDIAQTSPIQQYLTI